WALHNLAGGRAVYATGSDREAARLTGLEPRRVVFWVFALAGMLVGIGALLATVRFHDVPANAGLGLELTCITAVVMGGTVIAGFSVSGTNFWSVANAFEIVRLGAELGLLSLALTPVLLTGGIDLSVGSMMGLCAVAFGALWHDRGLPAGLCIVLALMIGVLG